MLKRTLTTALLVCTIPAVASASWFLSTQARNGGGIIDSRNMAGQSVTDGAIFKSYTTQAEIPVTVTANPGYTIRSVTVGGVTTTAPASPYIVTIPGSETDKSLSAIFAVTTLPVTASNPGGTVSPSSLGNIYYGYTLKNDVTFVFTPKAGYSITGISGVPSGASSSVPGGANQRASVTIPAGFVFNSAVSLQATSTNVSPTLTAGVPKTVIAGQVVTIQATTENIASPVFSWSYVSGPANVATMNTTGGRLDSSSGSAYSFTPGPALADLAGAATDTISFTAPSTPGQYKFKVTAGSLVKLATVNVVGTARDAAQTQCNFCHQANGIGGANLFSDWSGSDHADNGIFCAKCHIGANSGSHPGNYGSTELKNICLNCHNSTGMPDDGEGPNYLRSAHYQNPYREGVVYCASCHDAHRPNMQIYSTNHQISFYTGSTPTPVCTKCHTRAPGRPYGLYSSNGQGAAPHFDPTNSGAVAFTNNKVCTDCHGHNNAINGQWAQSGHGDVTSSAWAESGASSPCVRCHTTTGFINYSTFKVVTPLTTPIKTEVLACNGCHTSPDMTYSPFGNLTTVNGVTGTLRKIAAYPATYTQSGSANVNFQFPDVSASNLCIPCHSGRVAGKNIAGLTVSMNNTGFKNSHYRAAAGILYKSIGYEYAGQNYADLDGTNPDGVAFEHNLVGSPDAEGTGNLGPCVACHMFTSDGTAPGHTLHVFNKDANGQVTSLKNASVCITCHSSSPDPGALDFTDLSNVNAQINGFQAGLNALQAMLQSKGIYYNPEAYPYFYKDSTYNSSTGTTSDWTLGTNDNTQGKNNMGAAFNLNVLTKEPGAYAHNRIYTKRLIFDSIDWLQNGALTGSINLSAIPDGAPDGHGGTTPVFDAGALAAYLGGTRP